MYLDTSIRTLLLAWLATAGILYLLSGCTGGSGDVRAGVTPAVVIATSAGREVSTLEAMTICGNSLSEGRKVLLASQIDRISGKYLGRPEHRQAYIGLLCIESKFESTAKSRAGAIGIGQVMPKYSEYFSEQCGLGKLNATDLVDTEVNLTLSACHFGKLLEAFDGNIALALSGYNSGQDSETTRRLAKLADGHPETSGYIAKFYTYLNQLQIAEKHDVRPSVPHTK